jgi:hypothetical protein
MGTYHFPAVAKTIRRNKTYKGSLTKYRRNKQNKEILIFMLLSVIILSWTSAITNINKLAVNSFTIYSDDTSVGVNKIDTSTGVIAGRNVTGEERKTYPSLSVKDYVSNELQKNGINTNYAFRVITCESQWNPKAKNPIGTATGIWQFTQDTWLDGLRWRGLNWTLEDRKDYKKSTDMAIWFILREGWGRWDCINHI